MSGTHRQRRLFGKVAIITGSARRIDINLTGTANAIRAVAPYIIKRGDRRIIVTTSTYDVIGGDSAHYPT